MKKLYFSLLLVGGMVNAQIINIPDVNFKARLLAANSGNFDIAGIFDNLVGGYVGGATIDLNGDGEIEVSEAQSIQYLNVHTLPGSPYAINDLTGIEYITNLEVFECYFNDLTSLNLSSLTHLISVNCDDNQLTSLNLDNLTNLQYLQLRDNEITSFDFSGLPALLSVGCSGNLFSELDFHNNSLFFDLGCRDNPLLTTINLQNGIAQNTALGMLQFDGFGNCPNLHNICVDEIERIPLQDFLDLNELHGGGSHIVCSATCSFLSVNENEFEESMILYPNPTSDIININANKVIKSVQLFDVQGRILETKLEEGSHIGFDVSGYSNGIYFLKITAENGIKTEQFVKN